MYATYCMNISLYDNHLHMCCVHGDGMHILIASQIGPYFSYFMCVCVCLCLCLHVNVRAEYAHV